MSILLKLLAFACFGAFVLSSYIAQVDDHQEIVQSPPKMPMYIGSSYHIVYGNPKSQYGLDPGFYHPVFEYKYTENRTTQDSRFLIPDHVTSRKMSTCSFSTYVSSYRGTQSYQEDLKRMAKITIGSSKIQKYSFSLSRSWQRIHNSTTVQKNTLTHASAECQAYELVLDKFETPELTNNFKLGAIKSHASNNWENFIEEFGTHYVHELTMGGRATQEIDYTFQSTSKMESLNVDTSITAKASFAKFFADSSFDWSKYAKDISYSEQISTSRTQQYIGGQPPRTGNIYDWQVKIIDSPMPISYKMLPLSTLFENIKDKTFNPTLAEKQFEEALNQYCVKTKCIDPIPDFPKPKPATITLDKTPVYGSLKATKFDAYYNSTTLNVKKIHIRSGSEIDNIQLELSDGVVDVFTPAVGGTHGQPHVWDVPKGEYIDQIQYRSGSRIDSLTFITNNGNKSPKFGGNGGDYHLVNIPKDYRIVGFYGSSGSRVDGIGFHIAKTIYPAAEEIQGKVQAKLQIQ